MFWIILTKIIISSIIQNRILVNIKFKDLKDEFTVNVPLNQRTIDHFNIINEIDNQCYIYLGLSMNNSLHRWKAYPSIHTCTLAL